MDLILVEQRKKGVKGVGVIVQRGVLSIKSSPRTHPPKPNSIAITCTIQNTIMMSQLEKSSGRIPTVATIDSSFQIFPLTQILHLELHDVIYTFLKWALHPPPYLPLCLHCSLLPSHSLSLPYYLLLTTTPLDSR